MMKLISAIKTRRSVRSYQSKPVPKKVIKELIELANLAPTADGQENRRFIIVDDPKIKQTLWQAAFKQSHAQEAPVIVAACYATNLFQPAPFIKDCKGWGVNLWNTNEKNYKTHQQFKKNWHIWTRRWPIQDADAAIATFCLAATAKGLSTCWMGLFDHDQVRKALKLPRNYQIAALITLGYQKKSPYPQKRRPVKQLLHWNSWSS
ncbi:nitroreductase family protein [Patescibacteria group bacterium]|nr:nitroreductase family protein [Patescibacteria group bacterium]MBU1931123.1 nitroreductase family protein [Patescibacteria group bacterium]